MTKKQTMLLGSVLLFTAAVAAVILLRNTPEFTTAPAQGNIGTAPSTMEIPSKANVASSYTRRVEELKRSVAEDPANAAHMISLAQLLMDGHQIAEAIEYFEKASRLQPKNDSLLLDLAVCYFNRKEYEKALGTTERILAFDQVHSRALYNKGAIFAALNRKNEAVIVWKRLLTVAPNSEEAKSVRGHLPVLENQ